MIKQIKNAKEQEIKRICKEFGIYNFFEKISSNLKNIKKDEDIIKYSVAKEVINYTNSLSFKKEQIEKEIKGQLQDIIYKKYGDIDERFNIMNGLDLNTLEDKVEFEKFINNIYKKRDNILKKLKEIKDVESLNSFKYKLK